MFILNSESELQVCEVFTVNILLHTFTTDVPQVVGFNASFMTLIQTQRSSYHEEKLAVTESVRKSSCVYVGTELLC